MFPIWINDGTTEIPDEPIFYVIAKDGIYLKKTMGHFDTISKVNSISILGECQSFAVLHIAKIKTRQFAQILSLFREVYKKYRAEANIILHYNIKKKRYRIDIPPQGVTGASVQYENGLETYPGYTRIGTIHSHAGMTAFHSGTDQHDEEGWDGLHITLGKMGDKYFDISCSVMSGKERFMVNPEDYIEGIKVVEYVPETQYQSYRYIGGVREEIEPAVKLGWMLEAEEKDYKFPSKWMDKIDQYKPKPVQQYMYGGMQRFGGYDNLEEFYKLQGFQRDHTKQASYFDTFDNTFEVDPNGWSPCAQCPYKNHKSDILMKQVLEELADEQFLLEEEEKDEIAEMQNEIDGNIYDDEAERKDPFFTDDKETPLSSTRKNRKK